MSVSSLFDCHDKLRRGVVTGAQFMSALGSVRWPHGSLDGPQLEGLARCYATADVGYEDMAVAYQPDILAQMIDYKAFVRDVDPLAAAGALERNPGGSVNRLVPSTLALRRAGPNTSVANDPFVRKTLDKVKDMVASRRLLLKPTLVDLDAAGTSLSQTRVITVPRFQRALVTCGLSLAAPELSAVCAAFATDDNPPRVDYVRFLDYIDGDSASEGLLSTKRRQRMAAEAAVAEGSADGVGAVESPSALRSTGVGYVPWASTSKGVKDSAAVLPMTVDEIIVSMAEAAFVKGLRPSEYFRDRDRGQKGLVPELQVPRLLSQARCGLTPEQVAVLVANYGDGMGNFRYIAFEKDLLAASAKVQQVQLAKATATAAAAIAAAEGAAAPVQISGALDLNGPTVGPKAYRGGPLLSSRTPFDDVLDADLGELLYELRSDCARQGTHPGSCMSDHDPLRRGIIPAGAFQAAFSRAGLAVSETRLELLTKAYASSDSPNYVRYKDFLAALESGWVLSNLERQPTAETAKFVPRPRHTATSVAVVEAATGRGGGDGGASSATSRAAEVVSHVARQVSARRVELLQFFRDHDRLRRCRLTPAQFATVLGNAGLSLRPPRAEDRVGDLQHLLSVFSDPRGDIDYLRFIDVLERA